MRDELLRLIDLAEDVFPDDYKGRKALSEMCDGLRALAAKINEVDPPVCGEPVRWMNDEGGVVKPHEYQALANDNHGRWRPLYTAQPSQPVALPPDWVAVPRRWTREMLDAFYRFCPHTDALYIHQAVSAAIAAAPAGEGVPRG